MPGYRTHDKAASIATPIIIVASAQLISVPDAIAVGVAFWLANRYLSPDLDIDSIMNKRWGVLRFVWWPYKRMFQHRSFWTHSGPISATVRFIYLAVWVSPIFLILHTLPPLGILIALYVAMILADSLHTALDAIL
jgi:uncharacterized metal-binding protein